MNEKPQVVRSPEPGVGAVAQARLLLDQGKIIAAWSVLERAAESCRPKLLVVQSASRQLSQDCPRCIGNNRANYPKPLAEAVRKLEAGNYRW